MDKTLNKDQRITVRLTAHQNFMIETIAKKAGVSKAAFIRFTLDNFLKEYGSSIDK